MFNKAFIPFVSTEQPFWPEVTQRIKLFIIQSKKAVRMRCKDVGNHSAALPRHFLVKAIKIDKDMEN